MWMADAVRRPLDTVTVFCRDARGIRPGLRWNANHAAAASERVRWPQSSMPQWMKLSNCLLGNRDQTQRGIPARPTPHNSPPHAAPLNGSTSAENDPDIHRERLELENASPQVLERLGDDVHNAVFSFVPTPPRRRPGFAATKLVRQRHVDQLWNDVNSGTADANSWTPSCSHHPRGTLGPQRSTSGTFIASDATRRDLVLHVRRHP